MKTDKAQVYTVATAHLDTSWLWTIEDTIENYIPDTIRSNFTLLEKYPEYKFNFEGSLRYELIKEYYPDQYEKIKEYIRQGRWNPCGSCYENGDVNIPSPEAMIRNILLGNGFFNKEFGVRSNDIFLPDCFGFGRALPTVSAHCGLTGFSTCKLFWGCAVDVPFDTGKWIGPDGKGFWSALMPFSYTTCFKKIEKATRVLEKLDKNKKEGLPAFTFAYHGIGDRGGSPHKSSVKNVVNAQRNNDKNETLVYSATSKEYFDMLESLSEEQKGKMPVYNGEFLLTAHGAGSYTSRTVTKRWNKRCEQLADAAERFASAAMVLGVGEYPQYGFDRAWKNVIAHHFHDDITGTSFEECYKRNHNDYVQALNTFSSEFSAACKAVSRRLDTSFVSGQAVIVANALQSASRRTSAVSVRVNTGCNSFRVFDCNGSEVPSQCRAISDNIKEITFIAAVESCSLSVYDLRESDDICRLETGLSVDSYLLENKNIKLSIDLNGDICSVYDKSLGKELLNKPIRLAVFNNTHSFDWPAWEIKYDDLCGEPYMYPLRPQISVTDNGPASGAIEIKRTCGKSVFTQVISLDCESRYFSVYNETDWREEASLLKAEFSFTAENDNAAYDIGIGCTERSTNTNKLCEVPAQKWADITDSDGSYGVSVFSDSRAGWDKPDKSTLRLTLVHTPMSGYRWECSQHVMDMGINRFSFAVMGHKGGAEYSTVYADEFCQPMYTFLTDKHGGDLGKEFSFVKLDNDAVRITAIKKAQESDEIILRVAECSGNDRKNVTVSFNTDIRSASHVRGDEVFLSPAELKDGKLVFDIDHNSIMSFALRFGESDYEKLKSESVKIRYNATGITTDSNRGASDLKDGLSVAGEMLPESLLFAGVEFRFGGAEKNCLTCDGGEIVVSEDYDTLHLLVASLDGDKYPEFSCGDKKVTAYVPDCFEELGHWDLMMLRETGYIKNAPQAITVSHTHNKKGNLTAKQFYMFVAEIPLDGQNKVILPDDKDLVIFAATATGKDYKFINSHEHFDKLEKREFDYTFSPYAEKRMKPAAAELLLDRLFNRKTVVKAKAGEFYNEVALSELYYIVRKLLDGITYNKKAQKLISGRKKS